jgi:hypothetical protein
MIWLVFRSHGQYAEREQDREPGRQKKIDKNRDRRQG